MSLTPSNMMPLGTTAPDFNLLDVVGDKMVSLKGVQGDKGTVVMFICNHCPYVIHVNEEIVRIANDYRINGFGFVAINSNDVENYPEDSPENMVISAEKNNYTFPYLYDESQETAKAYDAACTPDFYLFDAELKLIYRGQLDDSRPGNMILVTGRNLREALDSVLNNSPQRKNQKPSMGCNIKWKNKTSSQS